MSAEKSGEIANKKTETKKTINTKKEDDNVLNSTFETVATGLERIKVGFDGQEDIDNLVKKYEKNPSAKSTLTILTDFGLLKARTGVALVSQIKAIGNALEMSAKNNKQCLITFSNDVYKPHFVDEYKQQVSNDISQLNVTTFQSILKTNHKYDTFFSQKTWQDIAIYLQSKGYQSRLLDNINVDISSFDRLANKKKEIVRKSIDPMFDSIYQKFSGTPEVKIALDSIAKKLEIPMKDGKLDLETFQQQFFEKKENAGLSETAIAQKMAEELGRLNIKTESIKKEAEATRQTLIQKVGGNDIHLEKIPGLDKNVGKIHYKGKLEDLSNLSIATINGEQAELILSNIARQYTGKPIPENIVNVILLLGLQKKLSVIVGIGSQATAAKKTVEKTGKRLTKVEIQKTETASDISVKRYEDENVNTVLRERYSTPEDMWKRMDELIALEKSGKISTTEKAELALIRQKQRTTSEVAQEYIKAKALYGEKEAQEIFREANQYVSKNPKESYDFKALEKINTLTDPETPRSMVYINQLKNGESVSMEKIIRSESGDISLSPEIQSIYIRSDGDSYSIPALNLSGLSDNAVREATKKMLTYEQLGLSQFIEHLGILGAEMRNKGIDSRINGQESIQEVQGTLKILYNKLFGKTIVSNSVPEIERAFLRALGYPTNMRYAMQHVLKENKLITESNQPIRAENIQKWMRSDETNRGDIAFM